MMRVHLVALPCFLFAQVFWCGFLFLFHIYFLIKRDDRCHPLSQRYLIVSGGLACLILGGDVMALVIQFLAPGDTYLDLGIAT